MAKTGVQPAKTAAYLALTKTAAYLALTRTVVTIKAETETEAEAEPDAVVVAEIK